MHAVARLALHPVIPNIQASWVKMGHEGVMACLNAGCNDLGGTLMNESITRAAGAAHGQETSPEEMHAMIHAAQRTPRQRTTTYARTHRPNGSPPGLGAGELAEIVNTPLRKRQGRANLVRNDATAFPSSNSAEARENERRGQSCCGRSDSDRLAYRPPVPWPRCAPPASAATAASRRSRATRPRATRASRPCPTDRASSRRTVRLPQTPRGSRSSPTSSQWRGKRPGQAFVERIPQHDQPESARDEERQRGDEPADRADKREPDVPDDRQHTDDREQRRRAEPVFRLQRQPPRTDETIM